LFAHETYHDTPDACFPNNWFSTHTDLECGESSLVLYPMKVPNRRKERRPDFLRRLERFLDHFFPPFLLLLLFGTASFLSFSTFGS